MPSKLKNLLLNYDPPGIGLEFKEGSSGEVERVHKDLPDKSKVHTIKDIYPLVDQIIAEEQHLTARRHRAALIQSLGRLYQIEVGEQEEAPDSDGGGHEAEDDNPWTEGKSVVLIALQGKLVVHNGEVGVITKVKKDSSKYEVTVKGEVVKLKGLDNMVLHQDSPLGLNSAVVIRGLRNHTELNGCLGRVVECHPETGRFEVRAPESGQLFRVKQDNLTPIDGRYLPIAIAKAFANPSGNEGILEPAGGEGGDDYEFYETGSTVKLVGLKTAMAYNGQSAEVLSVDRAKHRYEIKLSDGSVKTIRAENVRLVSGPPKSSPRKKGEGVAKGIDRPR
mmetsp:Transcript_32319/g.69198  ORF Transcript_32319/g.69198 Transcript_32319/m.69198 type:complete len:335 (-) Transcript_32319:1009-2013(-)